MHDYLIRAADRDGIIAILAAASLDRHAPYVWQFEGEPVLCASRVVMPWPEMVPGEPIETTDPETGETVMTTPMIATGDWLCRVLVDAPDEILAANAK
jgi:hypothetical protein